MEFKQFNSKQEDFKEIILKCTKHKKLSGLKFYDKVMSDAKIASQSGD